MIPNSASPTTIRTVEEQLCSFYHRRSVIDRLIELLEMYQHATPVRASHKKIRAA